MNKCDNNINQEGKSPAESNGVEEPKYRVLGESGLVEDEEGNMYSASEIHPTDKPSKPICFPHFQRNSFVSSLDDKCNPAYWYYEYDERYCRTSREEWMEQMAAKHRKMRERGITPPTIGTNRPPVCEPDCAYHLCEATRSHADLEQNEVIRLGIHPTFRKDFSYVRGLGFIAVVDKFGNVIISNEKYKLVGHYNYGLAIAEDRATGLFGFVDRHGREVVECKWRSVGQFSEYMVAVQDKDRKCGYVDVRGELAIPCKWEEAWPFHEGVARVQDKRLSGLIDQSGRLLTPCVWRGMGEFSEGLMNVMNKEGKCGYIDRTGSVVIPCQWQQAWSFKDGLAIVQDKNKRLGFIDRSGTVVIPCRWKKANPFQGSLAKVSDSKRFLLFKDKWVYIDRNGNIVREE